MTLNDQLIVEMYFFIKRQQFIKGNRKEACVNEISTGNHSLALPHQNLHFMIEHLYNYHCCCCIVITALTHQSRVREN